MSEKEEQNFMEGITQEVKVKRSKKTIINVIGCFYDDPLLTGLFRLNKFSSQIEYTKSPPWDKEITCGQVLHDEDLIMLKHYLAKNFKLEPAVSLILEGVIALAKNHGYHPVRDYLKSLEWDGTPRLNDWLLYAAGVFKDAYTIAVARKVLVAAVARVFEPGCEFHSMLILEGGQGIGKSTLVKILAGPFYANMSFANIDKDTIDAMQGRWIIEVDELVGFNRQDLEKMKSFITNPVDRARLSYQRMTKPFARQCVFVGTTNPVGDNTYFRDESGNRRFWPVVCGVINLPWLRENRDQLFAEAYLAYKAKETIYLDTQEAIDLARMAQEERLSIDPWTELLHSFMESKRTMYLEKVTILDLAKALSIDIPKFTRNEQTRIGNIMKKLGYEKRRSLVDGVKITIYYLNPTDGQCGQPSHENDGQPDNL